MRTRPRNFIYLSLFLVAVAAFFPVQIMFLYEHGFSEVLAIAAKLAPLNWLIIALAPFAGYLALRASPWLLVVLPTLIALVTYNNWLASRVGDQYSGWTTGLASVVFAAAIGLILRRDGLALLLNPHRRWWIIPLRKRIAMPVRLKLFNRCLAPRSKSVIDEFYIKTFDVSESGAFIPLDSSTPAYASAFENLPVGTQCYVSLPLKQISFIQCRAEVVRKTDKRGDYPAGVGIRFLGLSRSDRRKLNDLLQSAA